MHGPGCSRMSCHPGRSCGSICWLRKWRGVAMRSYEVGFTIEGGVIIRADSEAEAEQIFRDSMRMYVEESRPEVSVRAEVVEEEEYRKPVFERTRRTPL